jgi:ankyrin repeat protein
LGNNALPAAAQNGHLNCVEILLESSEIDFINSTSMSNWTAMHQAARYGHFEILKMLLERGADINIRHNIGWTALQFAVMGNHLNNVNLLLEKGIDVSDRDYFGHTSLIIAANNCYVDMVCILLERGIIIDHDIDDYAPDEYLAHEFEEIDEEVPDCRPLILTEVENRRKRAFFDSFIIRHIEYQPYINNIYARCYSAGNLQVAKPPVGWITAEAISDKYYFDEVFFYLHLHLANLYASKEKIRFTRSSGKCSNSTNNLANNNNRTSTLMTILTDRLKMCLKPDVL